MENTSITLMGRFIDGPSEEDWERFFRVYSSGIMSYAQSLGLSRDQAKDCLQEVMIVLIRKLGTEFRYDPAKGRFRGFLKQIIRYKVMRMREREGKRREELIDDDAPDQDLVREAQAGERENDRTHWKKLLVITALSKVETEYSKAGSRSFEIFRENVLKARPAAEVAAEHGETANNIYQIKSRIFARLETVILYLEEHGIDSIEDIPGMENI